MASTAVSTVAYPEMMITSVAGLVAFIRSRSAMPSILSILRSVITRSTVLSFKNTRAWVPPSAVLTS